MFPRRTKGDVLYDAGSFGLKLAKTPSCVSSDSRLMRSGAYLPCQRKLFPSTRSTPSVSIPRVRKSASVASGKSLPTTPTIRTGASNEAATAENVAAPPSTSRKLPEGMSRSSNAREPTMRRGCAAVFTARLLALPEQPREPFPRFRGDCDVRGHHGAPERACGAALRGVGEDARQL